MRCHYLSDLHLESQDFAWKLPHGDVLIVAGDLCHAACLEPTRQDLYAVAQRDRVRRFADAAVAGFSHVLLIAGNHDHYDGVLEDTAAIFRAALPGVRVLDNEAVEISGVHFFGTTLWTDFEGRNSTYMQTVRKSVGEFFFVKTRGRDPSDPAALVKFRPEHALHEHDRSLAALDRHLAQAGSRPTVVISHHAPSLQGRNPHFQGNGLDGVYASDLDDRITRLARVTVWVHGHTHIQRRYRIGDTHALVNCRGFDKSDASARTFDPDACFVLAPDGAISTPLARRRRGSPGPRRRQKPD